MNNDTTIRSKNILGCLSVSVDSQQEVNAFAQLPSEEGKEQTQATIDEKISATTITIFSQQNEAISVQQVDLKSKHSIEAQNSKQIPTPIFNVEGVITNIRKYIKKCKINFLPLNGNHFPKEFSDAKKILSLMKKNHLFWDPSKNKFRRKPSDNPSIKRIPASALHERFIIENFLISASIQNPIAFDVRDSAFDRVSLADQFLTVMKKPSEPYLYITISLPVPQVFKELVESYHGKMTSDNVYHCLNYLHDTPLENLLNAKELAKLEKKLNIYLSENESKSLLPLIKNSSYIPAFLLFVEKALAKAEEDVEKKINKKKNKNDKFNTTSSKSIKIVFEVLRNYSLGEFLACLAGALALIQKRNSRVVEFTVDGPSKHENSIKYLNDQKEIIKILDESKRLQTSLHKFIEEKFKGLESKSQPKHQGKIDQNPNGFYSSGDFLRKQTEVLNKKTRIENVLTKSNVTTVLFNNKRDNISMSTINNHWNPLRTLQTYFGLTKASDSPDKIKGNNEEENRKESTLNEDNSTEPQHNVKNGIAFINKKMTAEGTEGKPRSSPTYFSYLEANKSEQGFNTYTVFDMQNIALLKREKQLTKVLKTDVYSLINQMQKAAMRTQDPVKKAMILNIIYKGKHKAFPLVVVHEHLEGALKSQTLYDLAVKNTLYWDFDVERARRHSESRKRSGKGELYVGRVPMKNLEKTHISDLCCVSAQRKFSSTNLKNNELSVQFDKTFGPRGSILDRVSFSQQLLLLMMNSISENTIYLEEMCGIYDLPVPSAFKVLVETFHKKMNKENIEACIKYLTQNNYKNLLNENEMAKFISKVKGRFGKNAEKFLSEIDDLSYLEVFIHLLDETLRIAEEEIDQEIEKNGVLQSPNKKMQNLKPKIFDAKNPITLKLIFEVMRHYSLGEFFVWSLVAFAYIEKDNSRIVGITIDGPQKNKNSIKYFNDQVLIFEEFRKRFPRAKTTIHALEFAREEFENIEEAKEELEKVGRIADRIGHATMTSHSHDSLYTISNLKDKAIEICLSTVNITTGEPLENIPLKTFLNFGIPTILAPDDGGIVGTTMADEIIKAIEVFDLSFEAIETMQRTALEFSFLPGESIYNRTRELHLEGEESKAKLVYTLKEPFKSFKWDLPEEVNKSIENLELSDKQLKACQLELALTAFKQNILNNVEKYHQMGCVHPYADYGMGILRRSNSSD